MGQLSLLSKWAILTDTTIFIAEETTIEQVLQGKGICNGHVPGEVPARYMEIWEYEGYIYAVVGPRPSDENFRVFPLGIKW